MTACEPRCDGVQEDRGAGLNGRSPLVQVRLSNHGGLRVECPLMAAALQTGER
jgi:hypothetical protein